MKTEWHLLDPDVLEAIAQAAMFGNTKPGRVSDDWKGIPDKWVYARDKIARHLAARARGQMADEESGLNPLAHMIFDAMIALYGDIHGHKKDTD